MTSLLAKLKKTSKGLATISGFLVLPSCYCVNQPVLPPQPYQLHSFLSQYWSDDICCVNLCHIVENINKFKGTTFPQIKRFYCQKYYHRKICWISCPSGSPLLFSAHILQSRSI